MEQYRHQIEEGRWPANVLLTCPCEGEHLAGYPVR